MSKYTRPKIARARLSNPDREELTFTELEREVTRTAREGMTQQRKTFDIVHYQYDAPFFYENFRLELGRPWENATNQAEPDLPEEQWGVITPELRSGYVGAEFNPDGVELDVPPHGSITFVEDDPIIEVIVVGSACVPPGYVLLFGEPVEWKYPRSGVKMRIDGLWGEHMRIEPFRKGITDSYRDAGMSYAAFHIPPCKKVTIMAGSQHTLDAPDFTNMRHDAHYCVRHIYVGVQKER
jgi:hypothetical protein